MSTGKMVLCLGVIVYLAQNPGVLEEYTQRLYLATVSAPYQKAVVEMMKVDRDVRRVERAYESKKLNKPDTRLKLLALNDRYRHLLVTLSQSAVNQPERDELLLKIRAAQASIDRWGEANGF